MECVGHDSILRAQGFHPRMPDPIKKTEELPRSRPSADKSERTPWLVLGGVQIAVPYGRRGAGDRLQCLLLA